MLPPPLTGTGFLPYVLSIASLAARYAGILVGETYGSPPWCGVTLTLTDLGAILFKNL